jgi:hypothetical protein
MANFFVNRQLRKVGTFSPLELLGLAIQTWFERLIANITYQ